MFVLLKPKTSRTGGFDRKQFGVCGECCLSVVLFRNATWSSFKKHTRSSLSKATTRDIRQKNVALLHREWMRRLITLQKRAGSENVKRWWWRRWSASRRTSSRACRCQTEQSFKGKSSVPHCQLPTVDYMNILSVNFFALPLFYPESPTKIKCGGTQFWFLQIGWYVPAHSGQLSMPKICTYNYHLIADISSLLLWCLLPLWLFWQMQTSTLCKPWHSQGKIRKPLSQRFVFACAYFRRHPTGLL